MDLFGDKQKKPRLSSGVYGSRSLMAKPLFNATYLIATIY
jgi:hypothetical protein